MGEPNEPGNGTSEPKLDMNDFPTPAEVRLAEAVIMNTVPLVSAALRIMAKCVHVETIRELRKVGFPEAEIAKIRALQPESVWALREWSAQLKAAREAGDEDFTKTPLKIAHRTIRSCLAIYPFARALCWAERGRTFEALGEAGYLTVHGPPVSWN